MTSGGRLGEGIWGSDQNRNTLKDAETHWIHTRKYYGTTRGKGDRDYLYYGLLGYC